MPDALLSKLKIKDESGFLILNAPTGYSSRFPKAATKYKKGTTFTSVQVFVKNKEDLTKHSSAVLSMIDDQTIFWVCYPKKSGGIKTDLTRDYGWDSLTKAGYEVVSLVAIDETWSALRFKTISKTQPRKATTTPSLDRKSFTAVLENPEHNIGATFVSIPYDVEKTYGTKGRVKIKAWFDGYPYKGILVNMGTGCHVILVRKDMLDAIGKKVGDKVKVDIEPDKEERTIELPADLQDVLTSSKKAQSFFDKLSYTNRKEYVVWITSAKKEETRERRVAQTIEMLLKDKKNPSDK